MSEPSTHDWQNVPELVEGHGPVMQCTKCNLLKVGSGQPMMPCVSTNVRYISEAEARERWPDPRTITPD